MSSSNVSEILAKQTYKVLNSGHSIPYFGLGTWKSAKGEVKFAVKRALEVGYRHIDCAYCYENENEVGEGIKEFLQENTQYKRSDIFVTSKVWNTFHSREGVNRAIEITLGSLQLEYLDLFLIHWPVSIVDGKFVDPNTKETWQTMEELVDRGLVKSIGVSNFSVRKIKELLTYARIVPAMNQVELHIYLKQDHLLAFCESKGIAVTAYSPFGSPDRSTAMKGSDEPQFLDNPVVCEIANRLNKTPAHILIKFHLQRNTIVIPKSVNGDRILSNLDVFDWSLSEEDMNLLSQFPKYRVLTGDFFSHPTDGPYRSGAELYDENIPEDEL